MIIIDETLREKAVEYTQEKRNSQAGLADKLHLNRSYINQYINRAESLNQGIVDTVEKALKEKLMQTPKTTIKGEDGFLKTKDANDIIAVCQSCQEYAGVGIIVGKAGFGKTYTLKYYSKLPRVCYIECNELMNSKDLLRRIEKLLGLPHITGTSDERAMAIAEFFNANPGYLLIIDEADKLIAKYTTRKAETIRTIFDQANVGVVFAGEPMLESLVNQNIKRMESRTDLCVRLHGLSKTEVISYLDGYDFDGAATDEMIRRACNEKNGCFRLLDRTFKNIMRIANGEITIDTVREASSMMLL